MHMHENIKAITANIRGINASGKRQIPSTKWEKEGVDIALLSEVQKNTGGMKKKDNGENTQSSSARELTQRNAKNLNKAGKERHARQRRNAGKKREKQNPHQ